MSDLPPRSCANAVRQIRRLRQSWVITAKTTGLLNICFDTMGRKGYYTRLMSEHLPEYIDVMRLARQGRAVSGSYPVSSMRRLQGYLSGPQGSVALVLQFGIDENRLAVMRGEIRADLGLLCQRCMEPMQYHVEVPVELALVESEERAGRIPDNYEPLILTEEPSSLLEIVEDELILSLPIVAMHEAQQCAASALLRSADADTGEPERENPFAVLSELKKH